MLRIAILTLALAGCASVETFTFADWDAERESFDQCVEDCTDATQERYDCETECGGTHNEGEE